MVLVVVVWLVGVVVVLVIVVMVVVLVTVQYLMVREHQARQDGRNWSSHLVHTGTAMHCYYSGTRLATDIINITNTKKIRHLTMTIFLNWQHRGLTPTARPI